MRGKTGKKGDKTKKAGPRRIQARIKMKLDLVTETVDKIVIIM
jgi:hypothetical protein